ncbi:MAG: hypothetical protein J6P79_08650 [Pseudobutyrivibrio sp.]|nr:hypothetical protein [Pseudobutyrivibrio sp.]
MKYIKEHLNQLLNETSALLEISNKRLAKQKNLPAKHVRLSKSNGYNQFYLFDPATGTRTYIRSKELKNYMPLIQRDYDNSANRVLLKQYNKLNKLAKCIDSIDDISIQDVYEEQPEQKKSFITPLVDTKDEQIEKWHQEHPGCQNSFPIEKPIYTNKGETVRSKSEMIIDNLFYSFDIPYSYEPMLTLGDGHRICPDFAIYNQRLNKTIYWEHLGMIDIDDYAKSTLQKMYKYQKAGFEIGIDVLFSMESANGAFDSREIEDMIIKHCI